ncbi:type II toxin-antitoxin system Phd/YefM family antitoxin, partial [Roseateles sp.]|uniref:type II toxin-antitoxin system Phd/YefM family antitoxin n=1 Tax=Roseateles sp. TaxID=1971397 RepID=UPI00345DAE1B
MAKLSGRQPAQLLISVICAYLTDIYDAKTRLSQLVDKAAAGEDVVVCRNGNRGCGCCLQLDVLDELQGAVLGWAGLGEELEARGIRACAWRAAGVAHER